MEFFNQKIGIVGLGKLGKAIFAGFSKSGLSVKTYTRSDDQSRLGEECDVIFLCMRPADIESYLQMQSNQFQAHHRLISVAAGVGLVRLRAALNSRVPITYAILNTAVENNVGICAFACESQATVEDRLLWTNVLQMLGQTFEIDESKATTVMALSACVPGFFYDTVHSLAFSAVHHGLEMREATFMLAQVLKGASIMLEHSDKSAIELRQQVATPGGVTEQGLNVLKEFSMNHAFAAALSAAIEKIQKN